MQVSQSINFASKDHYFQEAVNDDRKDTVRDAIALLKGCAKDERVLNITVVVVVRVEDR